MLNNLKTKYYQFKESVYLWLWKVRLEIDYKLYVMTRRFA